MKKIIMLSLIAVFAICSLVAMQVTFQESSKSPVGEVHGYVYRTINSNGGLVYAPAAGIPVNIKLERHNGTIKNLGTRITGSSGFYTTGYPNPGHSTTEYAYAIVEYMGRTYRAVYTGDTRIDIYIDTNW